MRSHALRSTLATGGTTPPGQVVFAGTTLVAASGTWIVPAGVDSICVFGVGCTADANNGTTVNGAGCGGGAAGYSNNIEVFPGEGLDYYAGKSGDQIATTLKRGTTTLFSIDYGRPPTGQGGGGQGGRIINCTADVKHAGGDGGNSNAYGSASWSKGGGGGGAGGYAGNGGNGGGAYSSTAPTAGQGGGGGGGGYAGGTVSASGGGGGGVGLLGQGTNGTAGVANIVTPGGGGAGSNGTSGSMGSTNTGGGSGGSYGGGPGGGRGGLGGPGALRIIWGPGRAYPSTNTGDV